MNTREAFEAYRREIGCWDNSRDDAQPDMYRHFSAQAEWEAWQAGAAWAARECAEWAFNTYRQYRPKEDEFGEGKSEGAKEVAHIIAREFPEAFR